MDGAGGFIYALGGTNTTSDVEDPRGPVATSQSKIRAGPFRNIPPDRQAHEYHFLDPNTCMHIPNKVHLAWLG